MSKYNSKKTIIDGISFDSVKEAKRYRELKLLEKVGKIRNLQLQVKFPLIPSQYEETGETYARGIHKGEKKKRLVERPISYVADFVYEENGQTVVEDVKGYRGSGGGGAYGVFRIKRKLMLWVHGIKVKEV